MRVPRLVVAALAAAGSAKRLRARRAVRPGRYTLRFASGRALPVTVR